MLITPVLGAISLCSVLLLLCPPSAQAATTEALNCSASYQDCSDVRKSSQVGNVLGTQSRLRLSSHPGDFYAAQWHSKKNYGSHARCPVVCAL